MLVTASWGGTDVAVEVDAECRSVAALKRCLQEALPEMNVEAVRLEVCGRPVDDEKVLGLVEGSVIDVSATQAAVAATRLREEGCVVDYGGFSKAIKKGDVHLCKLYLEAGMARTSRVESPLHIAVRSRRLAVCELLVASGCPKDSKNKMGETPLHAAVEEGRADLCKVLIDAGCDKEVKDANGSAPLHLALNDEDVGVCKLLVSSGCDLDVKDGNGDTPLHLATFASRTEHCKVLLDAGCAKSARNDAGKTPLQYCKAGTNHAKLLRSRGCK